MEKALLSHNKHWKTPYQKLHKRNILDKLIGNLKIKQIQVLQGIRRSGKSTLFKLLINYLCDNAMATAKEILYINLDDPFFTTYHNNPAGLYEILQVAEKLTANKIQYLFLDEVQAINGWEKYIKTAYDNETFKKIFITGSNSSLLNSEYASLLSGRYLSEQVFPLSFNEILQLNNINNYLELVDQQPVILNLIDNMLNFGSFVEVYEQEQSYKREILSSYYDTIILKDCIANHNIRDIKSFREMSYYLISNTTSMYSYSSLGKAIGVHDQSAKEYAHYLESSYFFHELRHFSYSLKEQQGNKKKAYLIDNGFIALSFKFSNNYGALLENLVFSELVKQNKQVYFYNKRPKPHRCHTSLLQINRTKSKKRNQCTEKNLTTV